MVHCLQAVEMVKSDRCWRQASSFGPSVVIPGMRFVVSSRCKDLTRLFVNYFPSSKSASLDNISNTSSFHFFANLVPCSEVTFIPSLAIFASIKNFPCICLTQSPQFFPEHLFYAKASFRTNRWHAHVEKMSSTSTTGFLAESWL